MEHQSRGVRLFTTWNGNPMYVTALVDFPIELCKKNVLRFCSTHFWRNLNATLMIETDYTRITFRYALFDSLKGKLINYPIIRDKLKGILLRGATLEYSPDDEAQQQLQMFGFVRNEHNTCVIFCRIFEMRLYKQFLGESKYDDLKQLGTSEKSAFIEDCILNVPKIMQHFIDSQKYIYDRLKDETEDESENRVEKFLESEGRERFLTYLSPIINGVSTYSIEEQTRDSKRMDIVIHYLGKRYIIEVKIWRGERYNAEGEKQLIGYLDRFGLDTGYMLSFNFNKKKTVGVERISIGDKTLYEGKL